MSTESCCEAKFNVKPDSKHYNYPAKAQEERLSINAGNLHGTQPIIPKPREEPPYMRPDWFILSEAEGYGGVLKCLFERRIPSVTGGAVYSISGLCLD
jgi:hypothetical protein